MNALGWVVLAWCLTSILAACAWTWFKRREPGRCPECIRLARAYREARTKAATAAAALRRADPALEAVVVGAHMRLTAHLLEHPDTAAAIWEGAEEGVYEAWQAQQREAGDRDG